MTKVLLIEDDHTLRSFMRVLLSAQNYEVIEAKDAKQGITMALSLPIDVIILDLGLPDMDGLKVIEEIREHIQSGIIVVSARDKENDKIYALDHGADDYLTKPFNAQELLARIRVSLRHRSSTVSEALEVLSIRDIHIDFDKHLVLVKNNEVHLSPIEFEILALLMKNHGKVLTHHYLLNKIWGNQALENDVQTLRVTMANLRRKIESNPAIPEYILTEIGVGYRFVDS